jgi:hypothetical protein
MRERLSIMKEHQANGACGPSSGSAPCCARGGHPQWSGILVNFGSAGFSALATRPSGRALPSTQNTGARTAGSQGPPSGLPYRGPTAGTTNGRLSSHVRSRNPSCSQRIAEMTPRIAAEAMHNPRNSVVVNDGLELIRTIVCSARACAQQHSRLPNQTHLVPQ